jgi:hypothetical protein
MKLASALMASAIGVSACAKSSSSGSVAAPTATKTSTDTKTDSGTGTDTATAAGAIQLNLSGAVALALSGGPGAGGGKLMLLGSDKGGSLVKLAKDGTVASASSGSAAVQVSNMNVAENGKTYLALSTAANLSPLGLALTDPVSCVLAEVQSDGSLSCVDPAVTNPGLIGEALVHADASGNLYYSSQVQVGMSFNLMKLDKSAGKATQVGQTQIGSFQNWLPVGTSKVLVGINNAAQLLDLATGTLKSLSAVNQATMTVLSDGKIYWTDSSANVLRYDPAADAQDATPWISNTAGQNVVSDLNTTVNAAFGSNWIQTAKGSYLIVTNHVAAVAVLEVLPTPGIVALSALHIDPNDNNVGAGIGPNDSLILSAVDSANAPLLEEVDPTNGTETTLLSGQAQVTLMQYSSKTQVLSFLGFPAGSKLSGVTGTVDLSGATPSAKVQPSQETISDLQAL